MIKLALALLLALSALGLWAMGMIARDFARENADRPSFLSSDYLAATRQASCREAARFDPALACDTP